MFYFPSFRRDIAGSPVAEADDRSTTGCVCEVPPSLRGHGGTSGGWGRAGRLPVWGRAPPVTGVQAQPCSAQTAFFWGSTTLHQLSSKSERVARATLGSWGLCSGGGDVGEIPLGLGAKERGTRAPGGRHILPPCHPCEGLAARVGGGVSHGCCFSSDEEEDEEEITDPTPGPEPEQQEAEEKQHSKEVHPRELTEEEKQQILHSEEFLIFFDRSIRVAERALAEDSHIFFDYSGQDLQDKEGDEMRSPLVTHSSPALESEFASRGKKSSVVSVGFARFHPNLVVGGTYSGQIVLWDNRSHRRTPVQRTPLSATAHTVSSKDPFSAGALSSNSLGIGPDYHNFCTLASSVNG
ncbi:hypothetical protein Z043_101887 [Scleropages formosus]|uniref:Uncharacterized protein n=1 Tax=Scleropages formosus TaxID=113540 RepID=A0A0P7VQR2_SCLFO|nr:hypothetical protein Z043_101887 [Scleropages formosus]